MKKHATERAVNHSATTPGERHLRDVPFQWTFSVLLSLSALRAFELLPLGGALYAFSLALLTLGLWLDRGRRDHAPGFVSVLVLYTTWLVALYVYALMFGAPSNTLVIAIAPAPFALASLTLDRWPRNANAPSPGSRSGFQPLYLTSAIFLTLSIYDSLTSPPGAPVLVLSHYHAYLGVLIALLPRRPRYRWLPALATLSMVLAFLHYPSASVIAVVLAAGGGYVLLRLRRAQQRRLWLGVAVVVGAVAVPKLRSWLTVFYDRFDRTDNSLTREFFWQQGRSVLERNPVAGGRMEAPITTFLNQGLGPVELPFHNSYLTLAVAGGTAALALLACLLLLTVWHVLGDECDAGAAHFLFPALLAACASMAVNPVLDRLEDALLFYALVYALAQKRRVQPVPEESLRHSGVTSAPDQRVVLRSRAKSSRTLVRDPSLIRRHR